MIPVRYHRQRELNTHSAGFAPRDYPLYNNSLWAGCVGAWCPSLGVTGDRIRDWSIFKNDIILQNTNNDACWSVSDGRRSLLFDGSNDYGISERKLDYNLGNTASISFWFNQLNGTAGSSKGLVSLFNNDYTDGFAVSAWDVLAGSLFFYWKSASQVVSGSTVYMNALDKWYHVVFTNNNGSLTWYINGRYASPVYTGTSGGSISGPMNVYLSAFDTTPAFPNNCYLDDIRIYNRVLTENEIILLSRHRGIAYEPLIGITHHQPQEKVEKTPSFYWSERSLGVKQNDILWNTISSLNASIIIKWDTLRSISDTVSHLWDVLLKVDINSTISYEIRSQINDSINFLHNINALVEQSQNCLWNVKNVIQNNSEIFWNTLQSTNASSSLKWAVLKRVENTSQKLWTTLAQVHQVDEILFNVRSRLQKNNEILYNVNQIVDQTKQIKFDICRFLEVLTVLKWGLLQNQNVDVGLYYNILSAIDKSSEIYWDIAVYVLINSIHEIIANIQTVSNNIENIQTFEDLTSNISMNNISSLTIVQKQELVAALTRVKEIMLRGA